ncbi:hypothetical protein LWI29_024813 [Acer saccharum]|uniref:Uncharacterized protein n=1 Tax=Acer saccharum TaxID=4024 RepID=A0AA39VRA5_ACESA|nr:hypothetical protein LWI29_024813 [Acer saccharum]
MRRTRKQSECTEEVDSTAIMMRTMENSNEDPLSVRTLKRPRLVWTPQLHKWLYFVLQLDFHFPDLDFFSRFAVNGVESEHRTHGFSSPAPPEASGQGGDHSLAGGSELR